jgi:hypothetical protein
LTAQGANDRQVKQAESDKMVDAMRANGNPVSHVPFLDGPQNRPARSAPVRSRSTPVPSSAISFARHINFAIAAIP